ncbi:inorganic phosphate transporter [Raoultella sp. Lac2]|uniref:Phosphate transporter n=1 Tax=Klebsiella electrica TaxID=1259973 RepID=A0AAJ5UDF9_9ENTR|nr:inorganic phosphate transporter [Klebsiella electrica]MXF44996.1 inorganic phosphate transporter [Raoultella sp. Lac2]MXF97589.1 inorganic phosphate transporter [Raoultella sp. Lac1]BBV77447.1 phosphate transporter [Raoultella planticola]QDI09551.1 Low-affinity inorganic phosphate transporter 1 [Klebsiella electrica]WBW59903.1 inorganic phosphate transporter [Klebsiella electrica]
MSENNAIQSNGEATASLPKIHQKNSRLTVLFFVFLLAIGIAFAGINLFNDVNDAGAVYTDYIPFLLLGLALLIALGFEFVNGFHDTANAVATVIYTHSLSPMVAVIWSGFFNFLGVLLSSGVVAFGIISLLPVELILQAGTGNGFAMVYALLFSAIIWNLGTWWLGLPASSSHTLIGSIIGVGVANALIHGRTGTSGVDWAQAIKVGYALLLSPAIGFVFAALLLLVMKALVKNRQLYTSPKGDMPPPLWIRGLLILTCTGVSFAHGSNDGQKGMGLIMLILVGTMPIAYALNRSMPPEQIPRVAALAEVTRNDLLQQFPAVNQVQPREVLTSYVRTSELTPDVMPALAQMVGAIGDQIRQYGSVSKIPAQAVSNTRNDMYLASETIKHLKSEKQLQIATRSQHNLDALKSELDNATRFIPFWVKVVVAIALGLGTMVGWRRIVVTVGEKIGKSHLTYAQGASAELVAMATIGAADAFGLPVSTTHVLSSGIAGTMAANRSGLQMSTLRNLLMAWVLTLPVSVLLSATLYWIFTNI